MRTYHEFGPVFDKTSRLLILGSFPSVKSRENRFYYMHPQNRFWPLLAELLGRPLPETVPARKQMLLSYHIALWDVIASCEITGSADSSILKPELNNLQRIVKAAPIEAIFTNGKKAYHLYHTYQEPVLKRKAVYLPSTSPANAAYSFEKLKKEWGKICPYLK